MLVSYRVVGVLLFAVLLMGLVGSGCESRSLGWPDMEHECWDLWECNPDRNCGPLVQCVAGRCRSDLNTVLVECPYGDCIVEDDCVVAQPYTCCGGCPQVARRSDLAEMTCHYEGGTTPGPIPPECAMDCTACPICFPQPLGVECDLGRCVATVEGCSTGGATGVESITTAALFTNPQQYDGGSYRMVGTALPAPAGCDDNCPSFHCCDRSAVLDGLVRLEGSPCNMQLMFQSDDYCADTFDSEGILPGGEYVVEGILRRTPSEAIPWVMEVVGLEVASPRPLGGAYEVFVTAVEADANDPVCTPPTLAEGDWGTMYLAEEGGLLRVVAPLFDCHWEFLGTADPEGWFTAEAPVVCDGICDHILSGQVTGEMVFAVYTTVVDQCTYEYQFTGQRLPDQYDYPTE
jgi:hypothetical protein